MALNIRVINPTAENVIIPGVQLPAPCDKSYHWGILSNVEGRNPMRAYVSGKGELIMRGRTISGHAFGEFSYPTA